MHVVYMVCAFIAGAYVGAGIMAALIASRRGHSVHK